MSSSASDTVHFHDHQHRSREDREAIHVDFGSVPCLTLLPAYTSSPNLRPCHDGSNDQNDVSSKSDTLQLPSLGFRTVSSAIPKTYRRARPRLSSWTSGFHSRAARSPWPSSTERHVRDDSTPPLGPHEPGGETLPPEPVDLQRILLQQEPVQHQSDEWSSKLDGGTMTDNERLSNAHDEVLRRHREENRLCAKSLPAHPSGANGSAYLQEIDEKLSQHDTIDAQRPLEV